MDNFFNDEDLEGLLAELVTDEDELDVEEDEEMKASQKRYQDIIRKHRSGQEDE